MNQNWILIVLIAVLFIWLFGGNDCGCGCSG